VKAIADCQFEGQHLAIDKSGKLAIGNRQSEML